MSDGQTAIPPLNIEVSSASQQAINAIKNSGGNVICVYRTGLTLRHHVKPYNYDYSPRDPQPPPEKLLKMEKLREKGAEVKYVAVKWFEDEENKEKIKQMIESRKGRKEKLKELGNVERVKPFIPRYVEYLPAKTKKSKKEE